MTEIEEEHNLGDLFGPIRDQGERPTCLAFAASDLHAGLREGWEPLSCEFLFYHAQRRATRPPTVGATLPSILEALRYDGQPHEIGWPYLATVPVEDTLWKPPHDIDEVYRRLGERQHGKVDEIIALLDSKRPLLVLFYLSKSFYLADQKGLVDPPTDEQPDYTRRHAVVAIGHGKYKGRRVVLIRNSWGAEWGRDGHAWLTEDFLKLRLFGLAALEESTDVALPTATA
ncbi:MAG: C1 family peptidase [Rhodospirillaceae bacterium]|nr:C1 family peptidase [Rhodospirillaceae bacterium]MYB13359.1 C1 family peptidase [Rhodospirillaceae bacterium]MYI50839.1 C1 family peptidase [Rhodospirillaceae bacterium]